MKKFLQHALVFITAISVIGCAAPQKIGFNPDSKKAVKRVAVIETPEPNQYTMNPGQLPGGSALFMFGALGGAILGGIEADRFNSATSKFNEAVSPTHPNVSSLFISSIEQGLKQKGYEITRIPPPPLNKDKKEYDLSKIDGAYDAILVSSINSGYSARLGTASPQVNASISLLSQNNGSKMFSDSYIYGAEKIGANNQITPDEKYVFASIDAVYLDINMAVAGMKEGANKIAEKVLQEF